MRLDPCGLLEYMRALWRVLVCDRECNTARYINKCVHVVSFRQGATCVSLMTLIRQRVQL